MILTFNLTLLLFRILNSNKLDLLTLWDNLLILNQSKSLFKLRCCSNIEYAYYTYIA